MISKLFLWYTKAADAGHSWSADRLGEIYRKGDLGVEEDSNQAFQWFQKAANLGNVDSMTMIGALYADGYGIKQNDQQAIYWFTKGAEAGNASAANALGEIYRDAQLGVTKDAAQSLRYFGLAAQHGHEGARSFLQSQSLSQLASSPEAWNWYLQFAETVSPEIQYTIAQVYDFGKYGVAQDSIRAFYWYQKAAAQGQGGAQNNLGCMYLSGQGVEPNPIQAAKLFHQSSIQGSTSNYAALNLGEMYRDGVGVQRDLRAASRCFQLVAFKTEVLSQRTLFEMYYEGLTDFEDPEAFEYYAQREDTEAQVIVGLMYQFGIGTPKDRQEARQRFDRAIRQYSPWGQVCLALLLEKQEPLDVAQSLQLLISAAERGYPWAQSLLARRYRLGQGVSQDEKQAVQWYEKAAAQNDKWAKLELGEMYEMGIGVEKNEVTAVKLYREAAEQSLGPAQYKLAQMSETGRGVPPDPVGAEKWYIMAAERGIPEAQQKLGEKYHQYIETRKKDLLTPQQLSQEWLHLETPTLTDPELKASTEIHIGEVWGLIQVNKRDSDRELIYPTINKAIMRFITDEFVIKESRLYIAASGAKLDDNYEKVGRLTTSFDMLQSGKISQKLLKDQDEKDSQRPLVLEFLDSRKKVLLLLANEGMGKTTLCKSLVLQLGRDLYKEYIVKKEPIPEDVIIPIYISLRTVTDRDELLGKLIQSTLKALGLTDELINVLKTRQRFLFLLDGYDEMEDTKQNLYTVNHLENWKNSQCIISCRIETLQNDNKYWENFVPYPVTRTLDNKKHYEEIMIAPFNTRKIDEYIRKWIFNYINTPEKDREDRRDAEWLDFEVYKSYIEKISGLKELVKTPLFLYIAIVVLPEIVQDSRKAMKEKGTEGAKNEKYEEEFTKQNETSILRKYIEYWFKIQKQKLREGARIPNGKDLDNECWLFVRELATLMTDRPVPIYIVVWPQKADKKSSNEERKKIEAENRIWEKFFSEVPVKTLNESKEDREFMILVRKICPLTQPGPHQYAFLHPKIQEFCYAENVFSEEFEDDNEEGSSLELRSMLRPSDSYPHHLGQTRTGFSSQRTDASIGFSWPIDEASIRSELSKTSKKLDQESSDLRKLRLTGFRLLDTQHGHTITNQALSLIAKHIMTLSYVVSFTPCYMPNNLLSLTSITVVLYSSSSTETLLSMKNNPSTIPGVFFEVREYNTIEVKGALSYPPSITTEEYNQVWSTLQFAFTELPPKHSNITAITMGSHVYDPTENYEIEWKKMIHIIVHVHTVGYVPIGETLLPKTIRDIPIKVTQGIYTPLGIRALPLSDVDPVRPGVSVGMVGSNTAGTLGMFLRGSKHSKEESKYNDAYILTNHHIINEGDMNDLQQPASCDLEEYEKGNGLPHNGTKAYTIGVVIPGKSIIGDRPYPLSNDVEIQVGLDVGVCSWSSQRSISPHPKFELVHRYPHLNLASLYNNIFTTIDPRLEIIKIGRSSNRTIGTPVRNVSLLMKNNTGLYHISSKKHNHVYNQSTNVISGVDKDSIPVLPIETDAGTYGIFKQKPISITNQYLVLSDLEDKSFAIPGDSGSVCYIGDSITRELRPWGLLHGILKNIRFTYAIVTPIEAVMNFLGQDYSFY